MRRPPFLLAISAFLTLLGQSVARAEEVALTFDLPEARPAQPAPVPIASPELTPAIASSVATDGILPLPVPAAATNPPISGAGTGSLPSGTYGGGDAIALADPANSAASLLPPPPPLPETLTASVPPAAPTPPAEAEPVAPAVSAAPEVIALDFGIGPSEAELAIATAKAEPAKPDITSSKQPLLPLFEGGSNSLVARTVGSAEGTRTAEGQRTSAYFGHVDPGNGVWNLGTFSYQHGATTPEEADVRQLQRLQAQTAVIQQKALDQGLELSLQETLNGIDLANQAPLAALGPGSYIDWLTQARKLGLSGDEAIVWARTRAFLDPDTQRWNAPGLGNNVYSISRDQERRMLAIARALDNYQAQNPALPQEALTATATAADPSAPAAPTVSQETEETVDEIFHLDLEPAAQPQPTASGWSIAPGLNSAGETAPAEPVVPAPAMSEANLTPTPHAESAAEAAREGAQTLEAETLPAGAAPLNASETPMPLQAPPAADIVGATPETVVHPPVSQAPDPTLQSAAPLMNLADLLFQINL
ncbi:hypothetical protein [Pseudanabaena sp. FACHB-2040]|uniref:hypothetical protein n=1 Tax=Pseudanabaena sp. FACHB-2040 TaxID=2692859 RepID=UPI001689DFB8|nr:hypothetical protein [Pseudanabaena sp. FACHB-2040]MBD2259194.1 hypothetical protein [Pseudanabaena sp. FACHB-2040]